MKLLEFIHGAVLRLYPAQFRQRFSREIRQVFRTAIAESRYQSSAYRANLVLAFLTDTLVGAFRERVFASIGLTGLAWRELGRQRSFAITSVAAIALGIAGLVTAGGIAWQTQFRSYSYRDLPQLVKIGRSEEGHASSTRIPPGEYLQWTREVKSFESVGGFEANPGLSIVNDGASNAQARQYRITPSLFHVLGRQPVLGAFFEDKVVDEILPPLVLSHDFWADHMESHPGIIGKELLVDGKPHQVVGVMPEGFWAGADVWTRVHVAGNTPKEDLPASLLVWARLRDGVTAEQAGRELTQMASTSQQGPAAIVYEPFHPMQRRGKQSIFFITLLGIGASIVFLMGVANVRRDHALSMSRRLANRAPGRQRLLIALLAAVAGTGVSVALLKLPALLDAQTLIPNLGEMRFNTGATTALATSFALAALLLSWRARPFRPETLAGKRTDFTPVMAKTVLAGICLLTAGVVLRGYEGLAQQLSSSTDGTRWLNVSLFGPAHDSDSEKRSYYRQAVARLGNIPGVRRVHLQSSRELRIQEDGSFRFRRENTLPIEPKQTAIYSTVGEGPFRMGNPTLAEGRFFRSDETQPVAIVSQAFARRFFPAGGAVGNHVAVRSSLDENEQETTSREIVGIVNLDITSPVAGLEVPPWIVVPYLQDPIANFQVAVSLHDDAETPDSSIRDVLLGVTEDQTVSEVYPLAETPTPIKRLHFLVFFVAVWGLLALTLLAQDTYQRCRARVSSFRIIWKQVALGALGGSLLAVAAADLVRRAILEEIGAGRLWEFLGSLTDLAVGASLDLNLCLAVIGLLTAAASISGLLGARTASRQ